MGVTQYLCDKVWDLQQSRDYCEKEKAKLKLRIAEINLEIVDIDAEIAKCNKLLRNEK